MSQTAAHLLHVFIHNLLRTYYVPVPLAAAILGALNNQLLRSRAQPLEAGIVTPVYR